MARRRGPGITGSPDLTLNALSPMLSMVPGALGPWVMHHGLPIRPHLSVAECTYHHPVRISGDRRFISASEGGLCFLLPLTLPNVAAWPSSSSVRNSRAANIQRQACSTHDSFRKRNAHAHQCCDTDRHSARSAISRSLETRFDRYRSLPGPAIERASSPGYARTHAPGTGPLGAPGLAQSQ